VCIETNSGTTSGGERMDGGVVKAVIHTRGGEKEKKSKMYMKLKERE